MKKLFLFSLILILLLGMNSCSKDNTDSNSYVVYKVPVDLAASYVAMAFCNASLGINIHMENFTGFAALGRSNFDTSYLAKKTDSSAAVKYQYQVLYTYTRLTTSPPKVTLDYSADGSFSSSTLQSQDGQASSNWTLTTLDQPLLTLNGSGTDGGRQYSILQNVQFTSDISYTFNNVMMNKLTYEAVSGTATIRIIGSGPANVDFSYTGTLTFSGDRKAVLVLGGSSYNISLVTGSITK